MTSTNNNNNNNSNNYYYYYAFTLILTDGEINFTFLFSLINAN